MPLSLSPKETKTNNILLDIKKASLMLAFFICFNSLLAS